MGFRYPPLDCQQVKDVLKKRGFVLRKKKSGTSHEDWVGEDDNGTFCKVTVDCPKAPFSQDLISSMAKQAGLTKKRFYELAGYSKKGRKLIPSPATDE